MTTGNGSSSGQTNVEAILALDASTLSLKDRWQLPASQVFTDADWGTTPTLFADEHGRSLVAAINKNGYVYALKRSNLAAGYVWRTQIAVGCPCPGCGQGSVSSAAFGGGMLYAAGGNTTINGVTYPGAVRALDPATGAVKWQHAAPGIVLPALAYNNGLVIDGAGSTVEVLQASTGARLYKYTVSGPFWGAPSVSDTDIYIGSADGHEYVFGLAKSMAGALLRTAFR